MFRFRLNMHRLFRFYSIFKRDLINLFLNPILLLTNTLFPLLLILTLSYLGSSLYGGDVVRSYDYYGITILIFTALNVSITAANSFMEKSLKRSNLRIMYAPISPSTIYLAKILASFVFTTVALLLLIIVLSTVFNIQFGEANAGYVIFMLILFNLFSSALGVMFCCIFKSEEVSNKILSLINNLLAIVGGLFFQLDGLGKTAETISYLSPVKWISEGIFRIIYDHDLTFFYPVITIFLLSTLIFLWVCKQTFRVEDYV